MHTGTLYRERTPLYFLKALRALLDENSDLNDKLEVFFVGQNSRFENDKTIEEFIDEFRLNNIVKVVGFLSRRESLAYQISADLLLLIIGIVSEERTGTYGLSGKSFDYALARKPILALSQHGETANFLRSAKIGTVVEPDNMNRIKAVLMESYKKYQVQELVVRPDLDVLKKYDFKILTKKLAECFTRIVN